MKIANVTLLVLCLSLFAVPVYATSVSQYMAQGEGGLISLPVYEIDNTPADDPSCNISITDPEGQIVISGAAMNNTGYVVSYNVTGGNVSKLGLYGYDVYCDLSTDGFSTAFFEVTASGGNNGENLNIAIIIGLGIVAALFFYFAFHLEESHFILKLLLIIFALLSIALIPTTLLAGSTETARNFLRIPYWFIILFFLYFGTYLVWHQLKKSEKLMNVFRR